MLTPKKNQENFVSNFNGKRNRTGEERKRKKEKKRKEDVYYYYCHLCSERLSLDQKVKSITASYVNVLASKTKEIRRNT